MKALSQETILLVQVLATAMMTGIIWFVQIVHYPLFSKIPPQGFVSYELLNTTATGLLVGPIMLVEISTAFLLLILRSPVAFQPLYLLALGCLILVWLSTFFLQVPLHALLSSRPDTEAMRSLVLTNWIRTFLWTLRFGLLGKILLNGFCLPSIIP
jgi:hypothetical protein